MTNALTIHSKFDVNNLATLHTGGCLPFMRAIPDSSAQLVVTSPPYNIGKSYEDKASVADYVKFQSEVIDEAVRIVRPGGSVCWQVGHYVNGHGQIIPIDMLLYPCFAKHVDQNQLYLRNRIIWHFEHGFHCQNRFSGRHETILWFTKGDTYRFNFDELRVPQKYPGKKAWRGPKKGMYSGNPRGKNPGDVWVFPNVKGHHIEKTEHPCQFPVELVERLILAFTDAGDLVVDPFVGVGTTVAAALICGRRGAGADKCGTYIRIAKARVKAAHAGTLKYRDRMRPVYKPKPNTSLTTIPQNFEYVNLNGAALFS